MGDDAAEDLFILAARTGINQVRVLICPADFRDGRDAPPVAQPAWTPVLYARLREALTPFSRVT